MPTHLENLILTELSFVDKGANQHAKVTIFKRAKDEDCVPSERKRLSRMAALKLGIDVLTKDIEALNDPATKRIAALKLRIKGLDGAIKALPTS